MDDFGPKPRLRSLLDHFSQIEDPREAWRVAHPLAEVLLLIVCATIASCDDFDDIAAWGENHLPFLRRFLPFHRGIPGARWLNILMNRIDPDLFSDCFMSWASELRLDAPSLIALDGKTSRRSHDRASGKAALHLVSAFATRERLVLGQEAVDTKSNEITAIPALLERLAASGALAGALVTIDAIACNPGIAQAIVDHGADYLLAVKGNQPSLLSEMERFFNDADETGLDRHTDVDKGHGRIEERPPRGEQGCRLDGGRPVLSWPIPLSQTPTIAMIESTVQTKAGTKTEWRFYIISPTMTATALARASVPNPRSRMRSTGCSTSRSGAI